MKAAVALSALLIVVASALLLAGCEQSSPDPVATPAPTAVPEATPTPEPTLTAAALATPEATPGPALPPLPGAGSDGQPIQTQAFSLDDYATEVASDGSRTRRGKGSESAIVSLPLGESFLVTFSVTLNLGMFRLCGVLLTAPRGPQSLKLARRRPVLQRQSPAAPRKSPWTSAPRRPVQSRPRLLCRFCPVTTRAGGH